MSAYSQTDLDDLRRAIATGAMKVRQGEEEVSYRSLDDMLRTAALMERTLGTARINAANPVYSKGV